jgi:hypothetical protein
MAVPLTQRSVSAAWFCAPASVSVAEQHVEDVVALLAAGLGRSRSGEGCRCDAIPVDHPGTWLDAIGDQVLCLGGGSCSDFFRALPTSRLLEIASAPSVAGNRWSCKRRFLEQPASPGRGSHELA